jgi:hypothetical protein
VSNPFARVPTFGVPTVQHWPSVYGAGIPGAANWMFGGARMTTRPFFF